MAGIVYVPGWLTTNGIFASNTAVDNADPGRLADAVLPLQFLHGWQTIVQRLIAGAVGGTNHEPGWFTCPHRLRRNKNFHIRRSRKCHAEQHHAANQKTHQIIHSYHLHNLPTSLTSLFPPDGFRNCVSYVLSAHP